MNLNDIRNAYLSEGINYLNAGLRASHDVILALIARSPLKEKVTIKGGVVIQRITGDTRRATQDFDLDFIKFSLNEDSIYNFIEKLNNPSDGIAISIIAPIEELKHKDYKGLRAYIRITDSDGTSIDTKLDIGVHINLLIPQDAYCFDLCKLDDSVTLLINTKEQIFVEKLKSLLRLGAITTRYKDIYDMYWLATQGDLDKTALMSIMESLIFNDGTMREKCINDIVIRLSKVLYDPRLVSALINIKRHNWLDVDIQQVSMVLLNYMDDL